MKHRQKLLPKIGESFLAIIPICSLLPGIYIVSCFAVAFAIVLYTKQLPKNTDSSVWYQRHGGEPLSIRPVKLLRRTGSDRSLQSIQKAVAVYIAGSHKVFPDTWFCIDTYLVPPEKIFYASCRSLRIYVSNICKIKINYHELKMNRFSSKGVCSCINDFPF